MYLPQMKNGECRPIKIIMHHVTKQAGFVEFMKTIFLNNLRQLSTSMCSNLGEIVLLFHHWRHQEFLSRWPNGKCTLIFILQPSSLEEAKSFWIFSANFFARVFLLNRGLKCYKTNHVFFPFRHGNLPWDAVPSFHLTCMYVPGYSSDIGSIMSELLELWCAKEYVDLQVHVPLIFLNWVICIFFISSTAEPVLTFFFLEK